MINIFLFNQEFFLLEKLIRERQNVGKIKVFSYGSNSEQILDIINKYTVNIEFHKVPSLDDDSISEKLLEELSSAIDSYLIQSYIAKKSRFIDGVTIPEVKGIDKKIRFLQKYNITEFKSYSLSGIKEYKIEYTLKDFKSIHQDKNRCFIIGNGPSLNKIDMSLLKDEMTFGSNRVFYGFDKWGFQINYWAIVDRLQIEEYTFEYENNLSDNIIKFCPYEYISLFSGKNICYYEQSYSNETFSKFNFDKETIEFGFSVTYSLIQLAVYMGFKEIILVGMDHNYGKLENIDQKTKEGLLTKIKNKILKKEKRQFWTSKDSETDTHFDKRYTEGKKKFVPPRPEKVEAAYAFARQECEKRNISILNATPGTHLDVFKKVEYKNLFQERKS